MVRVNAHFRKRKNLDLNNFNYIQDINPKFPPTLNPFGFPVFREITDPEFTERDTGSPTDIFTDVYKQVNDTDDYGYFTTWYARPGVRMLALENVHVVVAQKGNEFQNPIWFMGQFGFRPCLYDASTQSATPLYDYFTFNRGVNLLCNNSLNEFQNRVSGKALDQMLVAHAGPDQIDYTAGGTYRNHPIGDTVHAEATRMNGTVEVGNTIYTEHELSAPVWNVLPDIVNFPDPLVIEVKMQVYIAFTNHPTADNNDSDPVVELINADDIESIAGDIVML